jgi:hypothetical protein
MAEQIRVLGDPAHPTTIVEDPTEIDNPIISFFLTYWRAERGSQPLPLRNSFSPREVRASLPSVAVADALPNYYDFRYRIVGSRISRYFLGDSRGRTLREVFVGENQTLGEGALWVYRRACLKRVPLRVTGPHNTFRGTIFPDFDALYLPYSSEGTIADRIVNVFTFDDRRLLT